MAALSIRDLDDTVRERLRARAARHGRSTEAEVRAILTDAVREPDDDDLFSTLIDRMAEIGGVDIDVPVRRQPVRAADLG